MDYGYIVAGVVVVWYLSHQAGRIDRLHHRIEVTEAALGGHLYRRAGIVAELANVAQLDPVTSAVLAQTSHDALAVEPHEVIERIEIENELSTELLSFFEDSDVVVELSTDPVTRELLEELSTVCGRIQLSHTFHSQAVADCLNIRSQWIVRIFRLAGFAQLPTILNFNSEVPAGLAD